MHVIFHRDTHGTDDVDITILFAYTPDEQAALTASNNWLTPCYDGFLGSHKMEFTRGVVRDPAVYISLTYKDFLEPGLTVERITDFFSTGCEKKFRNEYEPNIQKKLAGIVRDWKRVYRAEQTRARDAQFGSSLFGTGPVIDITPNSTGLPATGSPLYQRPILPPMPAGLPPRGAFQPMAKPPLNTFQTVRYSQIDLEDFMEAHLTSQGGVMSDVQKMTWSFNEPSHSDDHSLRLFLSFSDEEKDLIERWGLDDEPIAEEPMITQQGIEELKYAMQQELSACIDERVQGFLRTEHAELLRRAREEKNEIKLSDLAANPYVKNFAKRYEATQARRRLEQKLTEFRNKLEEYRKRTYE